MHNLDSLAGWDNADWSVLLAEPAREIYDRAAKKRQAEHAGTAPGKSSNNTGGKFATSDSRDAAGKAVGVSGKSVDFATITIPESEADGEAFLLPVGASVDATGRQASHKPHESPAERIERYGFGVRTSAADAEPGR